MLYILWCTQFCIHSTNYVLFAFFFLLISGPSKLSNLDLDSTHCVDKETISSKAHLQVSVNVSPYMYADLKYKRRSILLNNILNILKKMLQDQQPNPGAGSDKVVIPRHNESKR